MKNTFEYIIDYVLYTIISLLIVFSIFGIILYFASTAYGGTHSLYALERNKEAARVVFSESAIGEYSRHSNNSTWAGGGIQTELGVEFIKFINLSLGHSLINSQNMGNTTENMNGFRLNGGLKLIFTSPAVNLELGSGFMGSKYTYQDSCGISTLRGYGPYFTVGLNYFLARDISSFVQASRINEQAIKVVGETKDTNTKYVNTDLNLGIRIHF